MSKPPRTTELKAAKHEAPKSDAANRPAKWYNRLPWLACVGSIALFASWAAEQCMKVEWANTKADLLTHQTKLYFEETNSIPWQIALHDESARAEPDDEKLRFYAVHYIQHIDYLLGEYNAAAAQDEATAAEIRKAKTALQDFALDAFARGDTAKLLQCADTLSTLSNKQAKALTAKYRDKIEEVRANEIRWSNVFLESTEFQHVR